MVFALDLPLDLVAVKISVVPLEDLGVVSSLVFTKQVSDLLIVDFNNTDADLVINLALSALYGFIDLVDCVEVQTGVLIVTDHRVSLSRPCLPV